MQLIDTSLSIDELYKDFSLEMLALVAQNGKTITLIINKSLFNMLLYTLHLKTKNI